MKNELIIAVDKKLPTTKPAERLSELLTTFGLDDLSGRFA
jgi:hypothetical protein